MLFGDSWVGCLSWEGWGDEQSSLEQVDGACDLREVWG